MAAKVKVVFDPAVSLDRLTRTYTILAMDYYDGNKTQVAHSLGITIKTLYNWLHQWGIEIHRHWVAGQVDAEVAHTFVDEAEYRAWRERTGGADALATS